MVTIKTSLAFLKSPLQFLRLVEEGMTIRTTRRNKLNKKDFDKKRSNKQKEKEERSIRNRKKKER